MGVFTNKNHVIMMVVIGAVAIIAIVYVLFGRSKKDKAYDIETQKAFGVTKQDTNNWLKDPYKLDDLRDSITDVTGGKRRRRHRTLRKSKRHHRK